MDKLKTKNLLNKEIYNKKISNTKTITFEYVKILHEYLEHITNNMVIKDEEHYLFIINRGYDLLKNIFLILMLYTKNINLVSFHLRKSYLYYAEFIGQIGEDSNSYLQLNSKDACLFVYKKTVYDINEEFKKMFKDDDGKETEFLKKKILFINKLEKLVIKKKIFINGKLNLDKRTDIMMLVVKVLDELVKINLNNENEVFKKSNMLLDFMIFKNFTIEKMVHILCLFFKKINKTNVDEKKICSLTLYYEDVYKNLSSLKFVNKLFK
tara:strand:- start:1134 stop:1934 length:801 start_codon:yes stop_codon:yes gene_type:complete